MIVGLEELAASKCFPLLLTLRAVTDAQCKKISMNCCSVCIFIVFLMKDDDDKGMRVLIVAESRKGGKKYGALALKHSRSCNIRLQEVVSFCAKIFPHICHQELNVLEPCLQGIGSNPFPSSFIRFQMFIQ